MTQFTAQQKDLLKLGNLARIAGKDLLYLDVQKDKITAFATDHKLSVHTDIPCVSKETGTIAVNAKEFYSLIATSQGEFTLDGNSIKAGSCKAKLNNIQDIKAPHKLIEGDAFTIDAKEFISQAKRTAYACASYDGQVISGVLLDKNKLVATDGNMMAVNTLPDEAFSEQIIMPVFLVEEIIKSYTEADRLTFVTNKKQVMVTDGHTTLTSVLVEGKYPDYSKLIPQNQPITVNIDRIELLDKLSFSTIMMNEKTNMVKITLNNNLLTVSSNSEGGATCADLEIDYTGDEFIVGLNAQYLTKIMKVMQGNVVTFGFGTPLSAVTVQDCADDITVCMPLIIR